MRSNIWSVQFSLGYYKYTVSVDFGGAGSKAATYFLTAEADGETLYTDPPRDRRDMIDELRSMKYMVTRINERIALEDAILSLEIAFYNEFFQHREEV